ncbi:MAG: hypothetical protein WCP35_01635 [Verrucomicrobiota bacterium]
MIGSTHALPRPVTRPRQKKKFFLAWAGQTISHELSDRLTGRVMTRSMSRPPTLTKQSKKNEKRII